MIMIAFNIYNDLYVYKQILFYLKQNHHDLTIDNKFPEYI